MTNPWNIEEYDRQTEFFWLSDEPMEFVELIETPDGDYVIRPITVTRRHPEDKA